MTEDLWDDAWRALSDGLTNFSNGISDGDAGQVHVIRRASPTDYYLFLGYMSIPVTNPSDDLETLDFIFSFTQESGGVTSSADISLNTGEILAERGRTVVPDDANFHDWCLREVSAALKFLSGHAELVRRWVVSE